MANVRDDGEGYTVEEEYRMFFLQLIVDSFPSLESYQPALGFTPFSCLPVVVYLQCSRDSLKDVASAMQTHPALRFIHLRNSEICVVAHIPRFDNKPLVYLLLRVSSGVNPDWENTISALEPRSSLNLLLLTTSARLGPEDLLNHVLVPSASDCNPSAATLVNMVDELERSIGSNDGEILSWRHPCPKAGVMDALLHQQNPFLAIGIPRCWNLPIFERPSFLLLPDPDSSYLPIVQVVHKTMTNLGAQFFIFTFVKEPSTDDFDSVVKALGVAMKAVQLDGDQVERVLKTIIWTRSVRYDNLFSNISQGRLFDSEGRIHLYPLGPLIDEIWQKKNRVGPEKRLPGVFRDVTAEIGETETTAQTAQQTTSYSCDTPPLTALRDSSSPMSEAWSSALREDSEQRLPGSSRNETPEIGDSPTQTTQQFPPSFHNPSAHTALQEPSYPNTPVNGSDTCIVLCRASTREKTTHSTSLARQMLGTLTADTSAFFNYGDLGKIVVCLEIVSSAKHPFKDRLHLRSVLQQYQPTFLISTNVDRVTRRPDEIHEIAAFLTATRQDCIWLYVNKKSQVRRVMDDVDILRPTLALGRQVSAQQSLYTMTANSLKRVLQDPGLESDVGFQMITSALQDYVRKLDITRLIVVARASDVFNPAMKSCVKVEPTLTRQTRCGELLATQLGLPCEVVSLPFVSTGPLILEKIKERLSQHQEQSCLVFSTSADRLCRSVDGMNDLMEWSRSSGHHIVSLLWQGRHLQDEDQDYLGLGTGEERPLTVYMEHFRRYGSLAASGPVYLPVHWSEGTRQILQSAVQDASDFNKGLPERFFPGNRRLSIPAVLLEGGNERGFNTHLERVWKSVAEMMTGVEVDVKTAPPASTESRKCHCHLEEAHSDDCTCDCLYCRRAREALCPSNCSNRCDCLVTCPCRCAICHKEAHVISPASPVISAEDEGASTSDVPEQATTSKEKLKNCIACARTYVRNRGQAGLCHSCYRSQNLARKKAVCAFRGCEKLRCSKNEYCTKTHYVQDCLLKGINLKKCSFEGAEGRCSNALFPGTGRVCESHVKRAKKGKNYKGRQGKDRQMDVEDELEDGDELD